MTRLNVKRRSMRSAARKTTCGRLHASAGSQDDDTRYMCQATQLPVFTTPLSWWDVRQYVEDYVSGNVSLADTSWLHVSQLLSSNTSEEGQVGPPRALAL